MISISEENKIREYLDQGYSKLQISLLTGIHRKTILRIKKTLQGLQQLTANQIEEIRQLLMQDSPVGAIEVRLKIPRLLINAVKRKYFLQKRESGDVKCLRCPTCGHNTLKPGFNATHERKCND